MLGGRPEWIYDTPDSKPRRPTTSERLARNAAQQRLRRGLRARENWTDEDFEVEEQLLAAQVAEWVAAGQVQIFPPGWSRYE